MTNAISTAAAAITFTVKDGDIVTGTVPAIKKHPEGGILLAVEGNPMAFMPNSCIDGANDSEKAARRAHLIANPGTTVQVTVLGEPTVVPHKTSGKPTAQFKLSERHAVRAVQKAKRDEETAARNAALEATLATLVKGTIVTGKVVRAATKPSTREEGQLYTYGAFIEVAEGVRGLLHVSKVESGDRGLAAILAAGKATVEIGDSSIENGQVRVDLSQKAAGERAFAAKAEKLNGQNVKATVAKTGEVVDDIHGRILVLGTGEKVFLADDDACVKNESALPRGQATRVIGTGEVVGGMMRVTRRGV